jgi:hypothetical protein
MPDLVAALEWTAKKVLAASDNLAFLVGGLCRTPEPPYADLTEHLDPEYHDDPVFSVVDGHGDCVACGTQVFPSPTADSPAVVAAPGPEAQESGRPPDLDCAIPPAPSPAGTPKDDPVVAAFIASEEKREQLACDLIEAFDIDWHDIVYTLLSKYNITPK